ncbi:MAG: hypothetical protein CMO66_02620 [Verrucomicrobiales bacterium]|nr:hypothetical protein [Verrucomicrobiales bacterium]
MPNPLLAASAGNAALVSFTIYIAIVFVLAWLASRKQESGSFMNEYFLGSRNLGLWAFAFTYAATSASGGSFMGFPSLIYTHGWVLALWIGGYIVVPLVAIGLIAKRLNQVARKSGSITVPELMRKRLGSQTVGNVGTILLVFFQFFFLLAQFKAGAMIMTTLLDDVEVFHTAAQAMDRWTDPIPWVGAAEGSYLLCLLVFSLSVIAYTAWGGFRAVVWTDVMQGVIMGLGVMILLALVLVQLGGLGNATRELARQTPPLKGTAILSIDSATTNPITLKKGTWIEQSNEHNATHKFYLRTSQDAQIPAGKNTAQQNQSENENPLHIPVIQIHTPLENRIELSSIERELNQQSTPAMQAQPAGDFQAYAHGAGQSGAYINAPGPHASKASGFLPLLLAVCFFTFWPFAGSGQPSYMARQMAFRDTATLRHSIIFVMVYFSLIYFPLIIIFTSGRVLLPGWEIASDRIMPEMAAHLTSTAGVPWLAGLLVAAPFAAVMSSVDSFLLLVSSSVVRDIYQQNINPGADERTMKKISYGTTIVVGALAMLAMVNPPEFLQDLIVFASAGLGASFLMPVILTLYWPRLTARACIAGMISGGATIGVLYLIGYIVNGKFGEYLLLGLHPFLWSVAISTTVILVAAKLTSPPKPEIVENYFGKQVP